MTKIRVFKEKLARVFDNDMRTRQWENYIDYLIICLIVISTLSVFISTFNISPECEKVLSIIDIVTAITFTIEVTLRIWAADLISPKYAGFWGRVRYCFTFYGLIDVLSTYSFYVSMFISLPYSVLKALRVLRLLRVFRYMHSFRLLQTAISSKSKEMWVSFQFLAIVTLMLSFVLFFYEHNAQPEVYDNGFKSVVWAFALYVGDPGGFADTPPITFVGRLIACVIGLLGIALFAVPAGLIGSGFSEAMENEKNDAIIKKNIDSIIHSFKFEKDQHFTQLFVVPRYKELNTILTRRFLTVEDIVRAVEASDCLHLYNMANASNAEDNPEDRIVVMNYKRNTPYGCCIDRGSKVTIVFTSGYTEACTGWFAYHIAKLGGFNYIAKDVEIDPDNPTSYYNVTADCKCPNFSLFLEDLNRLTSRSGSWAIPILAASGPRSRPHQFHFCYNPNKKDESFGNPESRVTDFDLFRKLFDHVSSELKQKYDYNSDRNIYYAVAKNNIAHLIKADNVFTLRVECFVWMSDFRRVAVVKSLADCINAVLEPEIEKQLPPEMVSRVEGKDFGMQDYVD